MENLNEQWAAVLICLLTCFLGAGDHKIGFHLKSVMNIYILHQFSVNQLRVVDNDVADQLIEHLCVQFLNPSVSANHLNPMLNVDLLFRGLAQHCPVFSNLLIQRFLFRLSVGQHPVEIVLVQPTTHPVLIEPVHHRVQLLFPLFSGRQLGAHHEICTALGKLLAKSGNRSVLVCQCQSCTVLNVLQNSIIELVVEDGVRSAVGLPVAVIGEAGEQLSALGVVADGQGLAAVGTVNQTGKNGEVAVPVRALAAVDLLLHNIPCLAVNDRLVHPLHNHPLVHRTIAHPANLELGDVLLIGDGSDVGRLGQYLLDGGEIPCIDVAAIVLLKASVVVAQTTFPVPPGGRGNMLFAKLGLDALCAPALLRPCENLADNPSGFLVYDQMPMLVGAFLVTQRRIRGAEYALMGLDLTGGANFLADVPRIEVCIK